MSTSLDDISEQDFREILLPQLVAHDVLAQNHRSFSQQMAALRFADPDGHLTPTGLLIAGIDSSDHLPGAYVEFTRFDGPELTDAVKSSRKFAGPIPKIMAEIDEAIKTQIQTKVEFVGIERERRRPDIPFEALQQIVRNALIHRNYESTNAPVRISWFKDRVEVISPGGPFGQVTIETFGMPGVTDYRNPSLAGVLGTLGYVQRFGAGIQIARKALADNYNPPLELQPTATHVLATLRT